MNCCCKHSQKSPIIVLLLFWQAFISFNDSTVLETLPHYTTSFFVMFETFTYLLLLLLPFVGLIADAWIGRHKIIIISFYTSLTSLGFVSIGKIITTSSSDITVPLPYKWIFGILFTLGFIAFRANIVLYYIEILVIEGASSMQLSFIIYWHFFSCIGPTFLFSILDCIMTHFELTRLFDWFQIVTIIMTIIISILTHVLCRKHFAKLSRPYLSNPLKLILRILNYARKHKYPENRSALTYWEEEAPSQLDLGKEKYGGPFTEEEVEDVKTAFRMLPLLISVFAYATVMQSFPDLHIKSVNLCMIKGYNVRFILVLTYILLHQFIFRRYFSKYIPSMLKRIAIGLFCCFFGSVICTIVEGMVLHVQHTPSVSINASNGTLFSTVDFYWMLPHRILYVLAYILTFITSLEFTIAQSPHEMRGLLVGLWYAAFGSGLIIAQFIHSLFVKYLSQEAIGHEFYFSLARAVFNGAILIIFICLANRYKLRITRNEYDPYSTIYKMYQKYFRQRKTYYKNNYGSFQ